jgi:hypothetical protein
LTGQHGDPHGDPHDRSQPELTPEQESDVRRLLAEARHDEPIPPEVGDRLDQVLAGLTRDDPGAPGVASVVDLAARRRRRNAAAVLLGAAAVIVAGFAVGQVIDVGSSGDSGSSAGVAADQGARTPEHAPPPGMNDQSSTPTFAVPEPAHGAKVLRLRSAHLERDLKAQLGSLYGASDSARNQSSGFAAVGCAKPRVPSSKFGIGELFPALFDDKPAIVALRPPVQGLQRADVLSCDTAATLATASVPVR